MSHPTPHPVKPQLDQLMAAFFDAVSFEPGSMPAYENIHALFIEAGLLIKNTGPVPEISSLREFIEPRQAMVVSGELTRFREMELSETTKIFGNVAHRFSGYSKSGTMKGIPFEARGMITTQFIRTASGWRISAMAWDDERPGLSIIRTPKHGAVVFAKDLERIAHFYGKLLSMSVARADPHHVVLETDAFELVIHAIPETIARSIDVANPPSLRDEAPIKLQFPAANIAEAREIAAASGGQVNPVQREWEFDGVRVCDGYDPEGNVFQLRQPAL